MNRLRPLASLAAALFLSCGGDAAPTANPCASNPCLNGGTCSSSGGAASCTCATAFVGATCAQRAPVVSAVTAPATASAGAPVSLSAQIIDPDSLVTAVSWAFGDGATLNDTAGSRASGVLTSTVQHTYGAGGSTTVSATVTGGGVTSTKTATVAVSGGAASCTTTSWTVTAPGFEYDFSGVTGANPAITVCKGQTFTFQGLNIPAEHPFCIWNAADENSAPGVSGGDATTHCIVGSQSMTWAVPATLTTGARYVCNVHLFGNSFTIK